MRSFSRCVPPLSSASCLSSASAALPLYMRKVLHAFKLTACGHQGTSVHQRHPCLMEGERNVSPDIHSPERSEC
jgi:hypothetical protein